MKKKTREGYRPSVRYSFLKIMTGSDLSRRRLALMRCESPQPGPVVWLTGCAHGDEVGGVVVIQEVFKRLRKAPLRCGSVLAFPLMNPLGFEAGTRHVIVSGEDLNRCFPGNLHGTVAQRIARIIFDRIEQTKPTVVLDLHNDWQSCIPYALIDPPPGSAHRSAYAKTRSFAKTTRLLTIQESHDAFEARYSASTLTGSLLLHDIPAVTVELGESHVVNEQNVRTGVQAMWNVLAALNMVDPRDEQPEPMYEAIPPAVRRSVLNYHDKPFSSTSGIARFRVQAGSLVAPGAPIADIYNAFGKKLETVVAQHNGVVLGHSDSAVSFPGAPLVAFGLTDSTDHARSIEKHGKTPAAKPASKSPK